MLFSGKFYGTSFAINNHVIKVGFKLCTVLWHNISLRVTLQLVLSIALLISRS